MIGNPRPNQYKVSSDERPRVWRKGIMFRTGVRSHRDVHSLFIRWTPRIIQMLGLGIGLLFFRYFLVPLGHLTLAEQRTTANMDILDLR